MTSKAFLTQAVGLSLLLLAAAAPESEAAVGAQTRDDPLDGNWFWGNLTWGDEGGRISWDAAPEGSAAGGIAAGTPPTYEFTSEPLPRPLYLNAARLVKLDILAKGESGCRSSTGAASVHVSLELGGRLVAGATREAIFKPGTFPTNEPTPEGFKRCRYRMPMEISFVPAGASLTLRLAFTASPPVPIGVASVNPSMLALPIFTQEEAFYRMPEVIPRLRQPDADNDAGFGLLGSLGLAGLALTFGRGRPAWLAVAMLATMGFAGCLGGSEPLRAEGPQEESDDSGKSVVTVEDAGGTGLANATRSSLLGRVADPHYRPIPGAHVSVLGTEHFAKTDAHGLFALRDVAPGTYTVRVDKELYKSLETRVTLQANKVSRVEVLLGYDSSTALGERPHFHDYWNEKAVMTIFSDEVECRSGTSNCRAAFEFAVPPSPTNHLGLVLPGTADVEVIFEFDCKVGTETVGLAIQDNADPSPDNWTHFVPRRSGEPFHVQATWETTDVGHQKFSTWTFGAVMHQAGDSCSPPAFPFNVPGAVTTLLMPPTIKLDKATIKIKRGALPLEPRHPDHWNSQGWLPVMAAKRDDGGASIQCALPNLVATLNADVDTLDLGSPTSVVPAGTGELRFYLNQSRKNGPGGVVTATDWQLWYKTGDTQPEPYYSGSPLYTKAPRPIVSNDEKDLLFVIPVGPTGSDGIYNKKSAWRFAINSEDETGRCLDQNSSQTQASRLNLSFEAWAVRSPGDAAD